MPIGYPAEFIHNVIRRCEKGESTKFYGKSLM